MHRLVAVVLCWMVISTATALEAGGDMEVAQLREQMQSAPEPIQLLVGYRTAASVASLRSSASTPAELATSLKSRARAPRDAVRRRLVAEGRAPHRWLKDFEHFPLSVVEVASMEELEALLVDPDVATVQRPLRLQAHTAQSTVLINQPVVSSSGVRGAGTAVVVMDTGVNYTHPDFGSCTAPGVPSSCKVAYVADFAVEDNLLDSATNPHGTNVSGVVAKVAPDARIIGLDVFDGSSASSVDIIEAFDWAIANRASYNIVAINMSLGFAGTFYSGACTSKWLNPFLDPINAAYNVGITTVTSSGNDGNLTGLPIPACTTNAVAVGAVYDSNVGSRSFTACSDTTTAADKIACFSNTGTNLKLLAPGSLITAGGWTYEGTSQAAPHVAAAIALVKSEYPGDSVTTAVARLVSGGTTLTDTRTSPATTKPRLNLSGVFPSPGNDSFVGAIALSGSSVTSSGSNRFGSKEGSEPNHAGNSGGKSVWFNWTAPSSGSVGVNTSGSAIDTLLAVYTGSSVGALTSIAANDDSAGTISALGFTATAGTTYRIAVDGKSGVYGNFSLNLGLSASADLAVSLSDSPDPVNVGGSVNYALGVTNAGPSAATSVVATLTLPSGMTVGALPAGCTGSSTISCSAATLASGANLSFTIPATAGVTGTLTASASVSSAVSDPGTVNNSTSASTTVNPLADVGVTLTDSPDPINIGGSLSYGLGITNAGPSTATSVVATLALPSGMTVGTLPSGCAGSTTINCNLATLAAGGNASFTIPATASATGTQSASASVTAASSDSNSANNSASASTTVNPLADLALSLSTPTPQPVTVNDPVVLTVQVSNAGPSSATTPAVNLVLPSDAAFIGTTGSCSGTSTLVCSLGTLASGGSSSFTVTLSRSTQGAVSVTGSLTSTTTDPAPGNNGAAIAISFAAATSAAPVQVPMIPAWASGLMALYVLRRGARRRFGFAAGSPPSTSG